VPRLIPRKAAPLVVAVEDIINSSGALWNRSGVWAYRGQVFRADDPLVRRHPSSFEPAPEGVRFGPEPPPDEVAAVAQAHFVDNGRMVSPGRRFYAYDELVRERRELFLMVAPPR